MLSQGVLAFGQTYRRLIIGRMMSVYSSQFNETPLDGLKAGAGDVVAL